MNVVFLYFITLINQWLGVDFNLFFQSSNCNLCIEKKIIKTLIDKGNLFRIKDRLAWKLLSLKAFFNWLMIKDRE